MYYAEIKSLSENCFRMHKAPSKQARAASRGSELALWFRTNKHRL
jgi:hypothetical protein